MGSRTNALSLTSLSSISHSVMCTTSLILNFSDDSHIDMSFCREFSTLSMFAFCMEEISGTDRDTAGACGIPAALFA